jgi:putative component of membrane protein insertase Oxa1/YidC/SpoIIIJ protein YidD
MTNDNANLIDDSRTRCLCDVGRDDYIAATAVAADGSEHLVLARCDALGDNNVRYDPTCSEVVHEQLGELPIEIVRKITISRRTHRCGRRTKSGTPCRTPVGRDGDACVWHRTGARA